MRYPVSESFHFGSTGPGWHSHWLPGERKALSYIDFLYLFMVKSRISRRAKFAPESEVNLIRHASAIYVRCAPVEREPGIERRARKPHVPGLLLQENGLQ